MDSALSLDAPAARSGRLARAVELLLVGPGSLLLFPLAWLLRAALGLSDAELVVGFAMFHLAHVLNDPHFAVSYLLFYRDARRHLGEGPPSLRLRYATIAIVVPLVLVAWAGFALVARAPQALGWMAQLMYLVVGFHYAKQGFGVAMVLAGRRGVSFTARERTTLLVHAYAAWAFAWAHPAASAGVFEEKGVVYWAPSRPLALVMVTGVVLASSSLALLAVLGRRAAGDQRLSLPLGAFLLTLWFWTIFPSIDPVVRYMVPAFHALQYGYFVWLLRRNEAAEGERALGPPATQRVLALFVGALGLGWLLFRGLPSFLDETLVPGWHTTSEDLGATPFFAAFYLVVNLHHFAMDYVFWRRDHGETPWLFRDPLRDPEA